jgi:type VI protein secretion system component Hcp
VIFFVNHKHVSHAEADLQLHTFWVENFPGDEQLRSLSDLALPEKASAVSNGWGSFADTVVCELRRTKQFGTVEKFYIYIQKANISIFDPHVAYPAAT